MKDIATEAQEQAALIQWAGMNRINHPELVLLYHVANGGSRNVIEAKNLKAQGVRAGVPDLCLPVARGGYHALYIEMKRRKGGRTSPEQREWIASLNIEGNLAIVCEGWEKAADVIVTYLTASHTI